MTPLGKVGEYTVTVQGRVDLDLTAWFGPAVRVGEESADGPITAMSGIVADQSGIVGFIRHLHGLGILLLSVQRIEVKRA